MNNARIVMFGFYTALLAATASGCSWIGDGLPANAPSDAGTDVQSNNVGNNGSTTDMSNEPDVDDGPDEPAANNDGPKRYYSEPYLERCVGNAFGRCRVGPSIVPPAPAARLASMMLSEPEVDCAANRTESGDGLACAFLEFEEYITDPLAPEDFSNAFVYEVYEDDAGLRIGIFEVDADGNVVESSLFNDARSRWGFDEVSIEGTTVTARAGLVPLKTDYWGFPLPATVRDATFEGTVTRQGESWILESGEVEGHIEIMNLHANLNNQASVCLDEPTEWFTDMPGYYGCNGSLDMHFDETCQNFGSYCVLFAVLETVADLDLDEDGLTDAFSTRLRVEFTASERRF